MKAAAFAIFVLISLLFATARAEFYQWTDSDGVVHFTDSRKNIPNKYRKKAKKVNVIDDRPGKRGAAAAPVREKAPPPHERAAPPVSQQVMPGGHNEEWWRENFRSLNMQLSAARDTLANDHSELATARRKRAIYMRIRDREAVNALTAKIDDDEKKINDLINRINALEQEAESAGVPPEWRR